MIEYADASDLFYVWLKRVLFDIEPDLFGPSRRHQDGLQNKDDEIIVRRVHEPGRVRHDTDFYETIAVAGVRRGRRVLRPDGHLVVVFGHSDPDAWRRLLGGAARRRLRRHQLVAVAHRDGQHRASRSSRSPSPSAAASPPRSGPVATAAQVDREVTERGQEPRCSSGTRTAWRSPTS